MSTDKGVDAAAKAVPNVAGSSGVAKPASIAAPTVATEIPPSEIPRSGLPATELSPSGLPAVVPQSAVMAAPPVPLPVAVAVAVARPSWRRWVKPGILLLVLLLAVVCGGYWWLHPRAGLPPGIASGNGRLEADEIDIDTKFAGRIAKLFVDEGDLTKAGEVLAKMDTQDLEASLKKDQALSCRRDKRSKPPRRTLEQQKVRWSTRSRKSPARRCWSGRASRRMRNSISARRPW